MSQAGSESVTTSGFGFKSEYQFTLFFRDDNVPVRFLFDYRDRYADRRIACLLWPAERSAAVHPAPGGSVAKTRKPFLVQDIRFGIWENTIPGCVVSVNIGMVMKGLEYHLQNEIPDRAFFDIFKNNPALRL